MSYLRQCFPVNSRSACSRETGGYGIFNVCNDLNVFFAHESMTGTGECEQLLEEVNQPIGEPSSLGSNVSTNQQPIPRLLGLGWGGGGWGGGSGWEGGGGLQES